MLANDANDPTNVLPGAEDWMGAGSRVDHNIVAPYTIEIQIKHFSGAQAGSPVSSSESSGGEGGGGCFIVTAASGPNIEYNVYSLALFLIAAFYITGVLSVRQKP